MAHSEAIRFSLVKLEIEIRMLRLLVRETALAMDVLPHALVPHRLAHKISTYNCYTNRLCTQSADQANLVHGANGYSRHWPFEHILRHHRRYRMTEDAEEIQMRKVAVYLFGFGGSRSEDEAGQA